MYPGTSLAIGIMDELLARRVHFQSVTWFSIALIQRALFKAASSVVTKKNIGGYTCPQEV